MKPLQLKITLVPRQVEASRDSPSVDKQPRRRRIASNVVALFEQDRQPVVQGFTRWRGRYPCGVTKLYPQMRLNVGDLVEMVASRDAANIGLRAVIAGREREFCGRWLIRCQNRACRSFDVDTGEPAGESWEVYADAPQLRRVWRDPKGA